MGQTCTQPEDPRAQLFAVKSEEENDAKQSFLNPVLSGSILDLSSSPFSAPGEVYASSDDKRLACIEWNATKARYYTNGSKKASNRLVVDGKNNYMWSVSRDLSLRQWNTTTGECMQTISDAHELNLSSIVLDEGNNNDNGNFVYTGSRDYSVKKWDATTGKCIIKYTNPRNIVTAMKLASTSLISTPISGLLFQASEDLKVRAWDTRTPGAGAGVSTTTTITKSAMELTDYIYFALCIDLHHDGYTLATGCKGFNSVGCEMKIWDLRYPKKPYVNGKGHSQDVTSCKFIYSDNNNVNNSDSGTHLVSCCKDGSIKLWDWQRTQSDTGMGMGAADTSIASTTTSKYYTSMTQLYHQRTESQSQDDEKGVSSSVTKPSFVLGAFDGSVQTFDIENISDGDCEGVSIEAGNYTPAYFASQDENED
jgi:hypothetical protein